MLSDTVGETEFITNHVQTQEEQVNTTITGEHVSVLGFNVQNTVRASNKKVVISVTFH